eukprot:TRINITY_DN29010_c0_g1_i1.p1 TRINITY_DN29010_c0_g1~~TRINITY_DN29010_c0_g1_i1.p1  ORF type:complete len:161 (-),score=29.85 TRINITY_DN29010_c0_g1_i1:113-544(-)
MGLLNTSWMKVNIIFLFVILCLECVYQNPELKIIIHLDEVKDTATGSPNVGSGITREEMYEEDEPQNCDNCANCDKQHYCWHCQTWGCWVNANCKYCKNGIKSCIKEGFCGKVCGVKDLPEKQPDWGKIAKRCVDLYQIGNTI